MLTGLLVNFFTLVEAYLAGSCKSDVSFLVVNNFLWVLGPEVFKLESLLDINLLIKVLSENSSFVLAFSLWDKGSSGTLSV